MWESIAEISKLVFVAAAASLFTTYITSVSFRNKRWWELKVSAYQSTIEALSDMLHSYRTYAKVEMQERTISDEEEKRLDRLVRDGYSRVRKAIDMGAFIFSDEVIKALEEYKKNTEVHQDNYFEHIDSECAELKKCLDIIVKRSKGDLQLKGIIRF